MEKEYSIDLERLEAKCSELLHRRTARLINKQIRKEQAMDRRERITELAGMVGMAVTAYAAIIACIVLR